MGGILGSVIILGVTDNNTPTPISAVDIGGGQQALAVVVDGAITLPSAITGPGNPTVDSFASAVIDLAASTANQTIIAAPGANKQIWVYSVAFLFDTAAGTVVFHDSTPTALTGTMAVSDEGGLTIGPSGNFSMPILKCGTNTALQADTGAGTVDGWLTYAVISI